VLLADLDHFKWVNDRFGHAVGDRVLRLFADTAVACLRPEDLVGRLGGEGFVAILSGAGAEGAAGAHPGRLPGGAAHGRRPAGGARSHSVNLLKPAVASFAGLRFLSSGAEAIW
jgi:GGDEF domain-containing protein